MKKYEILREYSMKNLSHRGTGWKLDEVSAALKSWVMALDSIGELQKKELESWAKCIAHSYNEREE